MSSVRPLLLGHRGVRPLPPGLRRRTQPIPPENTLAAFEYALANGCDGFEFDVRFTRDARQVLCHDPKLSGREISASSYEDLCATCNSALSCLEDVLRQFGRRAYLDIEVKVCGGEQAVVKVLRQHPPERGYVVSSFLPEVLFALHELDPSLPLGYICDKRELAGLWRELPIQIFIPQYKLVSPQLVLEVHERALQLFAWTVNRRHDMIRLANWRVDALISDSPALLVHTFGRR